ncbi:MAG: hypothetical protein ACJAYM_002065 [Flavobacteriales bacterium]
MGKRRSGRTCVFADSNPKGLYILKEAHSGKKKKDWKNRDVRNYLNKFADK